MPHAFVEIKCSCNENKKYHCYSHDKDTNLEEFNCHHFKCKASKKAKYGFLLVERYLTLSNVLSSKLLHPLTKSFSIDLRFSLIMRLLRLRAIYSLWN